MGSLTGEFRPILIYVLELVVTFLPTTKSVLFAFVRISVVAYLPLEETYL